jgi:hypothetical protein
MKRRPEEDGFVKDTELVRLKGLVGHLLATRHHSYLQDAVVACLKEHYCAKGSHLHSPALNGKGTVKWLLLEKGAFLDSILHSIQPASMKVGCPFDAGAAAVQLSAAGHLKRVAIAPRSGWHRTTAGLSYLLPQSPMRSPPTAEE